MKRQSFNIENHLHYFTFSCYRRQELLNDELIRDALLISWRDALKTQDFKIISYVIMPNHVHILIRPTAQNYIVASILRRLKEPFSRWLTKQCLSKERSEVPPQLISRITTTIAGKQIHRVWQKGGGFDRNLYSSEAVNRAIEYIEYNPIEAGLVSLPELWRWSSAFARKNPNESLLAVDSIKTLGTEA